MIRRLSFSNLAWPATALSEALSLLSEFGVQGIEVAPTRIASWDALHPKDLKNYRAELAEAGLVPSSLQAIFFGVNDAQLLGTPAQFETMRQHIHRIGEIGQVLGASVAVFGAPRNRNRGERPVETATDLAAERLLKLGVAAQEHGLVMAMEPVPELYNSDFLQTWQEVLSLVRQVDHPSIRLHLDTACVALGGGDIAEAISAGSAELVHFHAAQPKLGDFTEPLPGHEVAGQALRAVGYEGWIAVEMLEQLTWQTSIDQAQKIVSELFILASKKSFPLE